MKLKYAKKHISHIPAAATFCLALLISIAGFFSLPGQAKAAAFVSTQTGSFNLGTTWGGACSSSCTAGTDFPGTSDTAEISAGTTVTLSAAAGTIAGVTVDSTGVLATGSFTITDSGDLTVNGTLSGTGAITVSGTSHTIFGSGTISAPVTLGANYLVNVSSGKLTISSVIGGSFGLNSIGTGTLALGGSNSFTGQLTVSSGTLAVSAVTNTNASGPLGHSTNAVILGSSGATVTLEYTGTTGSASKKITLATSSVDIIQVDSSTTTLTVSGVIAGPGSLAKAGAGAMTPSGTNTYTGATIINGGTINVSSLANGGSNSRIGASSNAASNLVLNGGTLTFTSGSFVTTDRLFSVGTSGGTISLTSTGDLYFNNTGAIGNNGQTGPRTLTLNASSTGTCGIYSTIDSNSGPTALVVNGSGTWGFSGVLGGSSALGSITINNTGQTIFYLNVSAASLTLSTSTIATSFDGAFNASGAISISSPGQTTFSSTVTAGSITQSSASSTVSFGGPVNSSGTISITGSAGTVFSSTTTAGGISQSAGTGPTSFAGAVNSSGAISITTSGSLFLGANITNTSSNISFNSPVTLSGSITVNSSAGNGNVSFNSTVDSDSPVTPRSLAINAGTGTVTFGGAVGNTTSVFALYTAETSGSLDSKYSGGSWSALPNLNAYAYISSFALDATGNVYAGGTNNTIGLVSEYSGGTWSATNPPGFGNVNSVIVDGSGNLYAGGEGPTGGGLVSEYSGGNWTSINPPGINEVKYLLLDGSGNIYAGGADGGGNGVVSEYSGGSWSALPSPGGFAFVSSLGLDGSGNLYAGGGDGVYDGTVSEYSNGSWTSINPSGFVVVTSLAVDGAGNVYAGGLDTSFTTGLVSKYSAGSWTSINPGGFIEVYSLIVDKSGNLYAAGYISNQGLISEYSGGSWTALPDPSGLTSAGDLALYQPTGKTALGDVTITSSGGTTFSSTLNAASFTNTAGNTTMSDNVTLSGGLTIASGTLTGPSTGKSITLGGNWSNSGTFTPQSGTVVFDGTNQTIGGASTFNNLTKNVGTAATLTFPATLKQTITGTLNLSGAVGQPLSLVSSSSTVQWQIDPQGTRTLSNLHVSDSNNTNATAINATGLVRIINGGDDTNWNFGTSSSSLNSAGIDMPTNFLVLNTGLVGYWPFDGANTHWTSSTTATTDDVSGNGNTGTLNNMNQATSPVLGKIGQALKFNGTSPSSTIDVSIPDSMPLALQGGSATFSLWIKPVINKWPTSYTSLIEKRNNIGSVNNYEIYLALSSGYLGFYNGALFTTSFIPPTGVWTLITVTVSNSVCTFYQNGNFITSYSGCSIGSAASGYPTLIGYYSSSGFDYQQFDGSLDDVRIYNRALSATEIQGLYSMGTATHISASPKVTATTNCTNGLSCGLIGYWTFDGKNTHWTSPTAATTDDVSGNGNTGTLNNMNQITSPVLGKIGQALGFNGTTTYVTTSQMNGATTLSAATLSAWVYSKANQSEYAGIIESRATNLVALAVNNNSSTNKVWFDWNESMYSHNTGYTLPNNQWVLLTVTFDTTSGNVVLYVNGKSVYSETDVMVPQNENSIWEIGDDSVSGSRFFNGSIDDARVYNRVLSPAEIQQLYNIGKI